MRYNKIRAQQNRKNGFYMVLLDFKSSFYDVKFIHPSGKDEWVAAFSNKIVAIKEAKGLAMRNKRGFNEMTDVLG